MSGAVFFSAGHTVQWLNEWLYVAPEDVKNRQDARPCLLKEYNL
jgi:hypothetical protein